MKAPPPGGHGPRPADSTSEFRWAFGSSGRKVDKDTRDAGKAKGKGNLKGKPCWQLGWQTMAEYKVGERWARQGGGKARQTMADCGKLDRDVRFTLCRTTASHTMANPVGLRTTWRTNGMYFLLGSGALLSSVVSRMPRALRRVYPLCQATSAESSRGPKTAEGQPTP